MEIISETISKVLMYILKKWYLFESISATHKDTSDN